MQPDVRIIAILRGITPQEICDHIACLLEQGICRVEIPTNSPDWQASIRLARAHFGPALSLGAGTVLTPQQVEESAAAGADFILTPNLQQDVVRQALGCALPLIAGVFTASEIFQALDLGVTSVKIFPACALPLDYPAQIRGPLSQRTHFSAVGGITLANVADYLQHYDSVGIGSSLYRPGQPVSITRQRSLALLKLKQ